MTAADLNAFLRRAAADDALQRQLRHCDPFAASELAQAEGFVVTVGDLIRYKSRATSWQLRDDELAVVAQWQPTSQPYWWQHIWTSDRAQS
jgi:predicted ribosomally synthesized peptide with nif11-like leader